MATKTPVIPLKEFQPSTLDLGDGVHTATTGWFLHQSKLYGKVAKRIKAHIKSQLEFARSYLGGAEVTGRRFYGLMKPLLAITLTANQWLHHIAHVIAVFV